MIIAVDLTVNSDDTQSNSIPSPAVAQQDLLSTMQTNCMTFYKLKRSGELMPSNLNRRAVAFKFIGTEPTDQCWIQIETRKERPASDSDYAVALGHKQDFYGDVSFPNTALNATITSGTLIAREFYWSEEKNSSNQSLEREDEDRGYDDYDDEYGNEYEYGEDYYN